MKSKEVKVIPKEFWNLTPEAEKIEELRKFISKKNSFHFNQIQKILNEQEKGKTDINLDILYKIHNNGHFECVEILKLLDKLFPKNKEE